MTMPAGTILSTLLRDDSPRAWQVVADYGSPERDIRSDAKQSLLARAILRQMICKTTHTDAPDWTFSYDDNGRPLALHNGRTTPIIVSLSHSGHYIACAIAQAESLGIDIEVQQAWRDIAEVAKFAFGPQERQQVRAEGIAAFYRIWTLREAHAKATGAGLAQATDRIDRFPDVLAITGTGGTISPPDPVVCHALTDVMMAGAQLWSFAYQQPAADLSCAVAARFPADRTDGAPPVWRWLIP